MVGANGWVQERWQERGPVAALLGGEHGSL